MIWLPAGCPARATGGNASSAKDEERVERTIAEGFALYLDLESGKYPTPKNRDRRDVERAGEEAVAALGKSATWSELIPMAAAQELWRHIQRRFADADATRRRRARNHKRNVLRKDHGTGTKNDGAVWAEGAVQHFFACAN